MNRKAQVFSWDVLIGAGIFVFILIASISVWDSYREKTNLIDTRTEMQISAENAMATLMLMPGEPGNWHLMDNFSVDSFGLVGGGDYILNEEKIIKMEEWNNTYYNDIKNAIGIREYELYLRFFNETGEIYFFGINKPSNAKEVVILERKGVMNNADLRVVMGVWDE